MDRTPTVVILRELQNNCENLIGKNWNENSFGNVERHSHFEKRSRQPAKTIFCYILDLDYFTENSKKDKYIFLLKNDWPQMTLN